jgi:imidazolonepropionase
MDSHRKNESGQKPQPADASSRQLFKGIGSLYTLSAAVEKSARRGITTADLSVIQNAAMLLENGRIVWVGSEKSMPKDLSSIGWIQEECLSGATVLPAFVECHTHLIHAGNRSDEFERRMQGESYQAIANSGGGILSTVRSTRAASQEELKKLGQERADRFLTQGVTTLEIKSGYALEVEGEFKMLRAAGDIERMRVVRTFLGAHAVPPEMSSAAVYVDHLIKIALPRLKAEGLACRVDVFVEDGYFSEDVARNYLLAAKELGFDLVVHADQLTRSRGAQLAVELGARSAEHLIQINESDIEKLSESEVTCVLLPSADLYMDCAYPPARKLLDRGARVALASDFNPGSSPSQDLALVGLLARIKMKMTLAEVICAYTLGAAYALGLEHQLGALVPGRFADFSVLSGSLEELFLDVGRMPIAQVYREGRRVL